MRTSGGRFILGGKTFMIKSPKTYEEQMNILKSKNIIISDKKFCLNALSRLNYYRFTAYALQYKINEDEYSSIPFEKIYNIYEFDRKLRGLLLVALEEIEILLRARLSYYHAHNFGPLGYLNIDNFNPNHRHQQFINDLYRLVDKNKDSVYVTQYIHNKYRNIPIWIAVELFSFGMLSRFYADMHVKDKKNIARSEFNLGYQQLESWLLCISTLRNRCAHYMRLYNAPFNKWPSSIKGGIELSNKIFDYIYIIKYCYSDAEKWNQSVFAILEGLIYQYEEFIELNHIGFPENWRELLRV
jgi:abortive infection bacteriophage resistance protein